MPLRLPSPAALPGGDSHPHSTHRQAALRHHQELSSGELLAFFCQPPLQASKFQLLRFISGLFRQKQPQGWVRIAWLFAPTTQSFFHFQFSYLFLHPSP